MTETIFIIGILFIALSGVCFIGHLFTRVFNRTHQQATLMSRAKLREYLETVNRR